MKKILRASRSARLRGAAFVAIVAIFAFATSGLAQPCEVVDNGTGTIDLPPAGCPYLSPTEFHVIVDGLPAGTTINVDPIHSEFILRSAGPGGNLGGEVEMFDSTLQLQMTGTGELAGFTRNIVVNAQVETHVGPRTPGDPVQSFDTEIVAMDLVGGGLFGDPDFDQLQLKAGSNFGLPSPGHTTLTELTSPGGTFNVDSFFDITYQIDFVGAPGSILAGMSGSSTGTIRMEAGESAQTTTTTTPVTTTTLPTVVFDHMQCFKMKDPHRLKGTVDVAPLQDPPFPVDTGCKIAKAKKFCIPVVKTATATTPPSVSAPPGQNLTGDYICYKMKCPTRLITLTQGVADQFGTRILAKFKTSELCVPAQKQ